MVLKEGYIENGACPVDIKNCEMIVRCCSVCADAFPEIEATETFKVPRGCPCSYLGKSIVKDRIGVFLTMDDNELVQVFADSYSFMETIFLSDDKVRSRVKP